MRTTKHSKKPLKPLDGNTMLKTKWQSLPKPARRFIRNAAIGQLFLIGAAHADLSTRTPEQLNGSKGMWRAATLVNFAGPLAYFAVGRRHK